MRVAVIYSMRSQVRVLDSSSPSIILGGGVNINLLPENLYDLITSVPPSASTLPGVSLVSLWWVTVPCASLTVKVPE